MTTILNDDNFEEQIKQNSAEKLALVDFFAEWCEPCKMLAPILEKVAEDFKDKIVLLKANLDDAPKISGKYGVEKIPTVILFKAGTPISGFVGLASEVSIKEWIENALKDEPDIQGTIERYDNYAKSNGFRLNPDEKTVERVISGLFQNEKKYGKKYCPCRRFTGKEAEDAKIICPCIYHKDEIEKDGHCFCNLFVK
jgi:ferredoxin-thioredoxin reductase catalytic chain